MFREVSDQDLAPMEPSTWAQQIVPSGHPDATKSLFEVRDFDTTGELPIVTKYEQVWDLLVDTKENPKTSREIPYEVLPREARHITLSGVWGAEGKTHKTLRGSFSSINKGSTDAARRATSELTRELLKRLLSEDPPWDLTRVIYEVSMRITIEYTLGAPVLHKHSRRLRELMREHVSAPGGFFGIERQAEAEDLLREVVKHRDSLIIGGLSAHLAELHDQEVITEDQLLGQLWVMLVSFETQGTAAANLLAALLEFDEYDYALRIVGRDRAEELLVNESLRRMPVFPTNLGTSMCPLTYDGITIEPGTPVLASYGAANLDGSAFEDPFTFNPRIERSVQHLAYGVGTHRCQGSVGATQFVTDVFRAALSTLPPLQLGDFWRETGISMAAASFEVEPT